MLMTDFIAFILIKKSPPKDVLAILIIIVIIYDF